MYFLYNVNPFNVFTFEKATYDKIIQVPFLFPPMSTTAFSEVKAFDLWILIAK